MKLSAILAPLIAAGVPGDVILATVKAFEDQQSDAIERRRESDRVRQQRRRHVTSRDVTVTERDAPVSDKEKSPTPPKEINSSPTSLRSETKRASRLPNDFEPDIEFAISQGLSRAQAVIEAAKFRDYWTAKSGKDATKLDWPATWRNWIRNASKHSTPRQQGPPGKTPFQQRHQAAIDAFDRKLGVIPDDEFTGTTLDLADRDFRSH